MRNNTPMIKRVIVDEAHEIVTSYMFRRFRYLSVLASLPQPKMYLTGTMPPNIFTAFCNHVGIPLDVAVLRSPTARPEIQYSVFRVRTSLHITVVASTLASSLQSLPDWDLGRSRGIVFCRSKAESEAIGELLGCPFYNSDVSIADRHQAQSDWADGTSKWISATSGFVHGIDQPYVSVVIFAGLPYSIIDMVQASARGGRRGALCKAIILDTGSEYHKVQTQRLDATDQWLSDRMQSWARDRVNCRRTGISDVFDHTVVRCDTLPHAHPCDTCSPDDTLCALMADSISPDDLESTDEFCDPAFDTLIATIDDAPIAAPQIGKGKGKAMDPFFTPASTLIRSSKSIGEFASLSSTFLCLLSHHTAGPSFDNPPSQLAYGGPPPPAPAMLPGTSGHQIRTNAMDVELARSKHITKIQVSALLNTVVGYLGSSCMVCWVWHNKLANHRILYKDCRKVPNNPLGSEYCSWHMGWMFWKSQQNFGQMAYCYYCHLPQGEFLPPGHPIPGDAALPPPPPPPSSSAPSPQSQRVNPPYPFYPNRRSSSGPSSSAPSRSRSSPAVVGAQKKCPMQDMVALVMWNVIHNDNLKIEAKVRFKWADLSLEEFASWACLEDKSQIQFTNGVEVLLWLANKRGIISDPRSL